MGNVYVAVGFAAFASVLEIVLVVLSEPLFILVTVGLVLVATDLLFVSWHPYAVLTSLGIYIFAVIVGLVGFSVLDLILNVV